MSNILWSMRICKRTFFPVCRMSGYVNTLVYFYLAPYSRQERYSTLQVYQRSYSQIGHIPPKMSDSLQRNVRQIWESTLSKSDYLVVRESGYLKIFFTFLEVNMSNILWLMRICKRTFFPVCRMSGYVNTLVYFYLAPYSRQER